VADFYNFLAMSNGPLENSGLRRTLINTNCSETVSQDGLMIYETFCTTMIVKTPEWLAVFLCANHLDSWQQKDWGNTLNIVNIGLS
jgi:hypothetical protein